MRPTPEEVQRARADAEKLLAGEFVKKPSDAIRVLLAATEPPTEEEIRACVQQNFNPAVHLDYSYASGATDAARHFFGPVKP